MALCDSVSVFTIGLHLCIKEVLYYLHGIHYSTGAEMPE